MSEKPELPDRSFSIVPQEPSGVLHYERKLREMECLWQCKCPIAAPYLKPVGQTLPARDVAIMRIPYAFGDNSYQRKKGLRCWWDGHTFEHNPVGCPIDVTETRLMLPKPIVTKHSVRQRNTRRRREFTHTQRAEIVASYRMFGYFCSWSCARAYGETHLPRIRPFLGSWLYKIQIDIVKHLKKEGKVDEAYRATPVKSALHFTLLKAYGGSMSLEEFRRVHEKDNDRTIAVMPEWLNIIAVGMVVSDVPTPDIGFRRRFNNHMNEIRVALPRRIPFIPRKRLVNTRSALANISRMKKPRKNAILDCIKS